MPAGWLTPWIDNLHLLQSAVAASRLAARIYGTSYRSVLAKTLRLIRVGRFTPEEALVSGLLDPEATDEQARHYVSKRELAALQARVNPPHWFYTTEDKSIFYRFCEGAGIPVPRTHAFLQRQGHGWTWEGQPLLGLREIGQWLDGEVPAHFIVKPCRGAHGRSVWVVRRTADGGFECARGTWSSGRELAEAILADSLFDAFVVQERLTSHPALVALTGSEALQSARLVTYVDWQGKAHVMAAAVRLITGEAVIDNIDWGRTGNVALQLDPQSGGAWQAMAFVHEGRVIRWVAPQKHPRLGEAARDFRLPDWDRAVDLVKTAAHRFLPLRTLGWDVALTPSGPRIVEANYRWDPMLHPCMREVVEAIRRDFEDRLQASKGAAGRQGRPPVPLRNLKHG